MASQYDSLLYETRAQKKTLEHFPCMPTCLLLLCLFRLDATTAVDAQQLAQIGHIQAQERDDRMLLYPADSVVLLKPGYPPDLQITAPFCLA